MTLHDSIEILTREHKTAAHTIDGLEIHTRPALLHMLREAVFGGMEGTGGTAFGAKLPISETALDLYTLIDQQIAEAWAAVHNTPPSTDRPEALAAQWSAIVTEDTIVEVTTPETRDTEAGPRVFRARSEYRAGDLASRWVDMIDAFFDPPRQAEIQAPCPACDERYVYKRKDGEDVRTSALIFVRDRATGETRYAACQACGAQWAPSQFRYLGELIAASETVEG